MKKSLLIGSAVVAVGAVLITAVLVTRISNTEQGTPNNEGAAGISNNEQGMSNVEGAETADGNLKRETGNLKLSDAVKALLGLDKKGSADEF